MTQKATTQPNNSKTIEITVPPLGESVTEASLVKWLHKAGDTIAEDALLTELETDKIMLEVTAPKDGVLVETLVEDGATVTPGQVLARFQPTASQESKPNEESSPPESKPQKEVSTLPPEPEESPPEPKPEAPSVPPEPGFQEEERHPLSKLRLKAAERLKQAQNTAAILTTFNEVDMHQVMHMRKTHGPVFQEKHGIKLGLMSFFVHATVKALREFPIINAQIQENDVVFRNVYHIGVAIGTDRGLVVPVLQNAENKGFADIEKGIAQLAEKARGSTLLPQDLVGGTFTISNGGVYGSMLSTPILNAPQSAILGLHSITKRPVVVENDMLAIRPIMYLALSYDHRLIDGKDAVGFLKLLKDTVESPDLSFLDL